MSWINSRQFTIADRNGRHYVFRRDNAGNTEINIPKTIVSKGKAIEWLKAHPEKVVNPNRYRPKRGARVAAAKRPLVPYKYVPPPPPKTPPGGWRYPAPKLVPYKKPNLALKNNWTSLTCDQLKSSLNSLTPIGKGRQGIVYTAHLKTGNRRPFAVKVAPRDLMASSRGEPQPFDVEFKIQDAVQILTPNVVRVYKITRCENFIEPSRINMPNVQNTSRFDKSKQGIILMEFATGGSLDSWLRKKAHVTDGMMAHIISDILKALLKIQAKYPDFRHNDLHMQNVFVADRGFIIGDFGWARLKKSGTNPAVNTANGTKTASFWGVGPNTDERYDHHLFLNELLDWAQRHSPADHPQAIEFLKKAVPPGYRGASDTHVSEWRLKYEDPCPGLPSLDEILSYPFLTGKKRVTSLNLAAAKAKLKPAKIKRIFSLNLQKAKAKLKAPKKNTKLVTSAQLRKAKAKLKVVPRPKPKPRITGYDLWAAKARLRKVVKSPKAAAKANATARKVTEAFGGFVIPKKKHKPIPREVLKSAKFNKMVNSVWKSQNKKENESFNNAWNRARRVVINKIQARINNNKPPFTPSPSKAKAPSPPKAKAKAPSPPKPKATGPNFRLSPSSGRAKIQSKNTGRWVYANLQSMDYLRSLAALMNVNVKGVRSKANMAKKIFGR
jgi:serine/threonine protein kinase